MDKANFIGRKRIKIWMLILTILSTISGICLIMIISLSQGVGQAILKGIIVLIIGILLIILQTKTKIFV